MAAITAEDVTFAFEPSSGAGTIAGGSFGSLQGPGRTRKTVRVTFPSPVAGAEYTVGGVALTSVTNPLYSRFGYQQGITSLRVIAKTPFAGNTNPYWVWNGSTTAPTLVGFECPTDAGANLPFSEATAGLTMAQNSQTLVLEVEGY